MELLTEAASLLDRARKKGATIATAESCTGGLIASTLTAIPGSSDVLDRGFVTYSNRAKTEMLGVPSTLIDTHGAVSEEVAMAMALGARERATTTLTVAVTGIAGPGGSNHKPEGRVCFAIASNKGARAETIEFGAIGREHVRDRTVAHALALLKSAL